MCPDLAFYGLVFNSKNQSKAVKEAKTDWLEDNKELINEWLFVNILSL